MQERHINREAYFQEQVQTTEKYVIPYVNQYLPLNANSRILEIGCAECGNLKPFVDMGCTVVGIDLNTQQVENGRIFLKKFSDPKAESEGRVTLISQDIYKIDPADIGGAFDLIIMRDVIEHIHNQEQFFAFVKPFLKEKGLLYMGFPPWYMPFGGHQQICGHRFLSKMPYFHILPMSMYKGILKAFGEDKATINDLAEIKDTGISIERLRKGLKQTNWRVVDETMYFINPNYEIKFGLKPRKQLPVVKHIPFVRNFLTTCCYYLVAKN